MTRKTSSTHATADADAVDTIVNYVAARCAGRNDALPSIFQEHAADPKKAQKSMIKALNEAIKRNNDRLDSDILASAIQTIADSTPPSDVVYVAQAIVAFAPTRTTGNLKNAVQAFVDVLDMSASLDNAGALVLATTDVLEAIEMDVEVDEHETAVAFINAVAAHTLSMFDRDAVFRDSALSERATTAVFNTFLAYEQRETLTSDDYVKAIVALVTYTLIKGDVAEVADVRQTLQRAQNVEIDADALGKMIGDIISASQPASDAQKAFVNKIYPGIDTANMTKRHAHKLIEQYKSMPSR